MQVVEEVVREKKLNTRTRGTDENTIRDREG